MKTWNRQRIKTRDRLFDYDLPAYPVIDKLQAPYPWVSASLSVLSKQLYELALQNGFLGTQDTFLSRFANGTIVRGTLNQFPIPGDPNTLYLDKETDILYYFRETNTELNLQLLARIGAAIVGHSIVGSPEEIITYLYIPVRAMPLEDIIFNCGSAAEQY